MVAIFFQDYFWRRVIFEVPIGFTKQTLLWKGKSFSDSITELTDQEKSVDVVFYICDSLFAQLVQTDLLNLGLVEWSLR